MKDSFRDALEYSALVSITDLQGRIVYCNKAFQEVSGYSESELMGQDHRILNSGYHPHSFWVDMWKQVCRGEHWRAEVCNRAKDGRNYWVDTTINPITNAEGEVCQYMSVRYDITERKQAEAKKEQLINDLQHYAFLTAHDLRRPMSSIRGLVNLFNMGAVNDEIPDILRMIDSQCEEMDQVIRLMNEVLNRNSYSAGP